METTYQLQLLGIKGNGMGLHTQVVFCRSALKKSWNGKLYMSDNFLAPLIVSEH